MLSFQSHMMFGKVMRLRGVGVSTGARLFSTVQNLFKDLTLSPYSQKALAEAFQYSQMTGVQAASIPPILQGYDVLTKARTGEGKTLAFLLPAAELLTERDQDLISSDASSSSIPILIISPNRELAAQIATEANELLQFQSDCLKNVVCVYGGRSVQGDVRALKSANVSILVATPGRLLDLLENTPHLCNRLNQIKMVVMDEADQLMEMGFSKAINNIMSYLPKKEKRQNIFFSATMPASVQEIAKNHLKPDYLFIDAVGDSANEQETHQHVAQEVVSVPTNDLLPAMAAIIKKQQEITNYKVIVFLTTARMTGYMASFFTALNLDIEVMEIHSRLSQAKRTRVSEEFRQAKGGVVLFSSDVSARGLDYPDVTHVVQVGSTTKAQYIHRLGRTARAGKEGSGTLLLFDFETIAMIKELSDMPLQTTELNETELQHHRDQVAPVLDMIRKGKYPDLESLGASAYAAYFGFYTNGWIGKFKIDKQTLVDKGYEFSRALGLTSTPALTKKAVGMLGLKGLNGVVVEDVSAPKKKRQGNKPAPNHKSTRNSGDSRSDGREHDQSDGGSNDHGSSTRRSKRVGGGWKERRM